MGITLGAFVGTMAGAHGQIEGNTLAEQLRRGFGKTFQTTLSRGWKIGVVSSWSVCSGGCQCGPMQMFGTAGGVYSAVECTVEKWRAKHDIFNSIYGGLGAGAALGAWSAREGPASRECSVCPARCA
jgi:mitochondrial import inner membrane translocase subunit TIM22